MPLKGTRRCIFLMAKARIIMASSSLVVKCPFDEILYGLRHCSSLRVSKRGMKVFVGEIFHQDGSEMFLRGFCIFLFLFIGSTS